MKQVSLVLVALAAVIFIVASIGLAMKSQIMGHDTVELWRGCIGLLGFSIALMLWESLRTRAER